MKCSAVELVLAVIKGPSSIFLTYDIASDLASGRLVCERRVVRDVEQNECFVF